MKDFRNSKVRPMQGVHQASTWTSVVRSHLKARLNRAQGLCQRQGEFILQDPEKEHGVVMRAPELEGT
jgi:hypothetical protein